MESKITYLIGAGASCEYLPIVNKIPKALQNFLIEFGDDRFKLPKDRDYRDIGIRETKRQMQEDFISSMQWVIDNAAAHSSIDTFAKKLYVTRNQDLLKLKVCLSIYFIYEQLKQPIDRRYDSFIASLINPGSFKNILPSNLNVLSWNYDFQFEKAISFYRSTNSLLECQTTLNVIPSDATLNHGCFSLYKLNGTAGFYKTDFNDVVDVIDDLSTPISIALVDRLIEYYAAMKMDNSNYRSMMHFAWENDNITEAVINKAIEATKDTTILIVIGYSFPFFNRQIDRRIIRAMVGLRNIYFQAPDKEAENYIDRFNAIRDDTDTMTLTPLSDVAQFFLPPEL